MEDFKSSFEREAKDILKLLPEKEPFTSHKFYTLYAMGYPLSYLKWLEYYKEVHKAHREISNTLRRLSDSDILRIERCGNVTDANIFGNDDEIALWKKKYDE